MLIWMVVSRVMTDLLSGTIFGFFPKLFIKHTRRILVLIYREISVAIKLISSIQYSKYEFEV